MDRESWTQLNRLLDEALDLPSDDVESWLAGLGPDESGSRREPARFSASDRPFRPRPLSNRFPH